jgi:hypothetical protein
LTPVGAESTSSGVTRPGGKPPQNVAIVPVLTL